MTLPVPVSPLTALPPNLDGTTKINAETGKETCCSCLKVKKFNAGVQEPQTPVSLS
jgi:hypothetical protein